MPVSKSALIRYKTIDKCLRNRQRRWTLEDLMQACSLALSEQEGFTGLVGKRTIQKDIQFMRSNKPGYHAPVVVVNRKYYTYSDPDYSITHIPLTKGDLDKLAEIVLILKQFTGFSHFGELNGMIYKLEDKIYTEKLQQKPVIEFEKNENLKGLDFLDRIYRHILQKQVIAIWYQSFKAQRPGKIIFYPYLLREYRNRWFVLGSKKGTRTIVTLALDRMEEIETLPSEPWLENEDFNSGEYFSHVIGVTVNNMRPVNVHLFADRATAPYLLTKPLHASQQIISESDQGIELVIKVIPNYELEREILGFGEHVKVLAPESLKQKIRNSLLEAVKNYRE
jgi:predicted DNA-binding transcriptional regulator YafY